jgi:hypothetical protein
LQAADGGGGSTAGCEIVVTWLNASLQMWKELRIGLTDRDLTAVGGLACCPAHRALHGAGSRGLKGLNPNEPWCLPALCATPG